MAKKYLLKAECGTTPPRYEHETLESAITEAKRLHIKLGCRIQILEIIGEVKTVQVPVTRPETQLKLFNSVHDDLPF